MGIRARADAVGGEARRAARARLRRLLRRRLTSPAARRRRRRLAWASALGAPLLLAAVVWGAIQGAMVPRQPSMFPPRQSWWLLLIRDDALRHLTAAERQLSFQALAHEKGLSESILAEANAAEQASAPAAYVAWVRLRAFREPGNPLYHWAPVPAHLWEPLTELRRLEPDEPLWELLWGCALIRDRRAGEGKAYLKRSLARPQPYRVPVLRAPWRWWAQTVPLAFWDDLNLILPASRELGDEAVALGRAGRVTQAGQTLELLRRLDLKLAQTETRTVAGRSGRGGPGPVVAMAGTGRTVALRRLLKVDREEWADEAHLALYQSRATAAIAGSTLSPVSWGWGVLPGWYWAGGALALGAVLLLASEWALRPWGYLRLRRRPARPVDLAIAGSTAGDLCCLSLCVAAAVLTGWVWHRVGYTLTTVPFGMCDCWLCGLPYFRVGPPLLRQAIMAASYSPPLLAALPTVWEVVSAWRLRRLCRRAGSGVWDRPLARRRSTGLLVRGALTRCAVLVFLAAFLATAAWFQHTTTIRSLDRALWPGASAPIMTEEVDSTMHVRDSVLAILAAQSVEEAIQVTPSALLNSPAFRLAEDARDPVEAAYWHGLEAADAARRSRYVMP